MSHGPELHEDLSALPSLLAGHGPLLLVRDPVAWEASGAAAALCDELTELGAVPFEEQGESPCLEEMQRAAANQVRCGPTHGRSAGRCLANYSETH